MALAVMGSQELFPVDSTGGRTSLQFEHLAQVTDQLRPLPGSMFCPWSDLATAQVVLFSVLDGSCLVASVMLFQQLSASGNWLEAASDGTTLKGHSWQQTYDFVATQDGFQAELGAFFFLKLSLE